MRVGWTPDEMAGRLARDVPDGSCINLGIGLPTLVAAHLEPAREVVIHSENGIVGMGPRPAVGEEDPDLVDAGKAPVTLAVGAAIVHHADSFALIRSGRLDIAVLGAMQVSRMGDLANWKVGGQRLGSVGGAMDLAVGARSVLVLMQHVDRSGGPKILDRCTYPLTASGVVRRVYTNLAVIDVREGELRVLDIAPDVSRRALQESTGPRLSF